MTQLKNIKNMTYEEFDDLLNKNIKIHGPINNINKILKYSICGINNVNIGTGFQTKILTYMSCGLPVISIKNYETKNNFIKKWSSATTIKTRRNRKALRVGTKSYQNETSTNNNCDFVYYK